MYLQRTDAAKKLIIPDNIILDIFVIVIVVIVVVGIFGHSV